MSTDEMISFYPLPGLSDPKPTGVMRRTRFRIVEALKTHRVVSMAGDHGAVTTWRDDEGFIRATFQVFMSTKAEGRFSARTGKPLRDWLDRHVALAREGVR